MPWFRVSLECACTFVAEPAEALYDLEDDATAVVSVTLVDADSGRGATTVALVLDLEAPDAGAAATRARAVVTADPDFERLSLGEVAETTSPRAVSGEAVGILRDAASRKRA